MTPHPRAGAQRRAQCILGDGRIPRHPLGSETLLPQKEARISTEASVPSQVFVVVGVCGGKGNSRPQDGPNLFLLALGVFLVPPPFSELGLPSREGPMVLFSWEWDTGEGGRAGPSFRAWLSHYILAWSRQARGN